MEADTVRPLVSVVIPCRNEKKFIKACVDSILANDYPLECLEVLVVDGISDDGTRKILFDFSARYPCLTVLDNPARITPAAFNIGIKKAKGTIVMLMGAHNIYPPNYISSLVTWLQKGEGDNVGGVCLAVPSCNEPRAQAIATGLSHPFGVGNAYFRIGTTEPRFVDTVFGGCYRREVFDRIGLFDEELVRNQDDEFNHRLIKHGGRILLVPEIVTYYVARDSLVKLWQTYYQYGYFKPLAARKIGTIMTARQLIPLGFVLSLILTASLAPWFWPMRILLTAIVVSYAALDVIFSTSVAFEKGARCGLWLLIVFPVLHISYGLGYLKGMLDFIVLQKRGIQDSSVIPLSR